MQMSGIEGETPMEARVGAGGAEIIQFPNRSRPLAAIPVPEAAEAQVTLETALAALNQALVEQLEAVQAWQEVTRILANSLLKLADGCCDLDARWSTVSSAVGASADERPGS
jgi:hypothetical protein